MKKLLPLFLAFACFLLAQAAPIDQQKARQLANQFMRGRGAQLVGEPMRAPGLANTNLSQQPIYIFNAAQEKGFVVVAGDDCAGPILGYVEEGRYDETRLPDGFRDWLTSMSKEVERASEAAQDEPRKAKAPLRIPTHNAISPLVKTKWDQGSATASGYIYNTLCPVINGKHAITGCVATAGAQVMYYHQHPKTKTKAVPGYTSEIDATSNGLPAITFNWSKMKTTYSSIDVGTESEKAVSQLMVYCGYAAHMEYGLSASGASTYTLAKNMIEYFDYDPSTFKSVYRSEYGVATWDEMMYNELANNRPIIYSGFGSGGHAFVCDGYDGNGYYHFNWGWGGWCDGYFKLQATNPYEGDGSQDIGFCMDQDAIIGLQPNTGQTNGNYVGTASNVVVDGTTVTMTLSNDNYQTCQFGFGMGELKSDGSIKVLDTKYEYYQSTSLEQYWGFPNCSFEFSNYNLTTGKHTLVPISLLKGKTTWRRCEPTDLYFEVTKSSSGGLSIVAYPLSTSPTVKVTAFSFPGNKFANLPQKVVATVKSTGNEFKETLYFFASTTTAKGDFIYANGTAIEKDGTEDVAFYFMPDKAGRWNLWVCTDSDGNNVIGSTSVTITNPPTGTVSLRFESGEYVSSSAYKAKVKNTGSVDFYRFLYSWITDTADGSEITVKSSDIHIKAGASSEVVFNTDILQPGHTYNVELAYPTDIYAENWYWLGDFTFTVPAAPNEAYAWLSSDGKKLTFCYDKQKTSRTGTTYALNTGTNNPGWYDKRASITSVVFNSAFASARPTSCYRWFYGMTKLTSISGLSNLNTSKVTNMASMFNACSALTSLDVSTFNTALVTTMNYMFYKCSALTTLTVGSLSTAKAPTMKYMFASCDALTALNISGIAFSSSIDTEYLLKDCSALKTLTIPSTANSLNANACTGIGTQSAPCTLSYPSGFTPTKDATGSGWYQWKTGYFKDATATTQSYAWLSSDGKKLTFCYDANKSSRAGTTYSLNTGTNNPGWYDKRTGITSVVFNSAFASARPTSCYRWFYGMTNLAAITNLKYLNTSKVTNMASMFNACSALTTLDVSTFNTALVTTMNYMFYKCSSLTSLTVGTPSTAKTPTMKYMFASCEALTALDLSGIAFSSSIDTEYLLKDCSALKTLTIPSTANSLNANACTGVGTKSAPCTLIYSSGFTPTKDATGSGWYQWKAGYFKDVAATTQSYAWLSSDGKKLTFCYDANKASRTGTTYSLNTGTNNPGWYDKREGVTSVVFNSAFSSARPTSCYRWFNGMTNLATITNLKYLNTSKVTNMASMFNACGKLTTLDVSTFNAALVTTMNYMFYKCSALTTLTVGSLSTAKAPTMKYMFASCSALTALDLSGISFSSSIDTEYMLKDCSALKTLTIPSTANSLNANACTSVGTKSAPCTLVYPSGFTPTKDATGSGWYQWKTGYFKDVPSEAYAWLSSDGKKLTFCYDKQKSSRAGTTYSLNTSTNNPGWYDKREGITSVVFNSAFSSARPTSCYRWFNGMTNLATITNLKYLNTSKVTNMASMFNACGKLTTLDVSTFNTALVTTMNYMFYKCSALMTLTVGSLSTAKTPTMKYMFASCSALTALDLSGITFSSSIDTEYMLKDCSALKTLTIPSTANSLNANACTSVGTKSAPCTLVYPSGFTPTKDATGSGWYQWKTGYFKDVPSEAYAWLSSDGKKLTFCYDKQKSSRAGTTYSLNTGTNNPGWYDKREGITSVVFNSAFSSARPTSCYRWFNGMTNLATITNIKYLNTSKVTNMASMFNACGKLTSLDVSTFNTALVTTMNYMFYKCSALTTLTVGSLSTAKAPTMKYMFASCSALTALDLSGISFSSSIDTEYLLKDCSALKTLTIPSTANSLNANACTSVGTQSAPCTLVYPSGFTPTKDATGSGWYQWKTGYFKDVPSVAYAWLSSDGKKLTFCYDKQKSSRAGTTYSLNTGTNNPGWYDKREGITSIVFNSAFSSARPTTCYRWFYGMTNLTSITGLSHLNTTKVTNMASMFNACSNLTSIEAYSLSTANVTTMNYMFYKCSKLTTLNLGYFSTAKATTMKYMFASCSALTSLDISRFTLTSSQETENMMKDCSAMKTLTIPSTANYLDATACTNVGTKSSPCSLVYPSGFKPTKDATGSGWFQWKGGYFKASTGSPGDANGQGEVTVSDVQIAMEYVLGKNPAGIVLANTEVTGDGEISINDVSAIAELVLNKPAVVAARAHESMTDMLALTANGSRCTVHLSAIAPYHAFQMTVVLPDGARLGNVLLADGRANGHHAEWHEVAPGRYNIVCWSSNGEALREGPTALLHFDISGCDADDVTLEAVQMVDDWCGTVLLPATSGIATGIVWIVDDSSNTSDSPYYNTVGIGSKTPQRGINIKDGKKKIKH